MASEKSVVTGGVLITVSLAFLAGVVYAQDWPDVFDPTLLMTLNIQMDPCDLNTILNDESFEIELPAWFWADGEENDKIWVAVRRKSGDPIDANDYIKVSFKIDINQYHIDDPCDPCFPGHPDSVEMWHGIKKLSLENGDDNNVLTEGIAANMHQMASCAEGYGHDAWRANWVKLYVNGTYYGVYVNAEQLDKTCRIMGLAEQVNLVLIDHAVAAMAVGITGANKTDYHIKNVVPGRDFALEGKNTKVVDIRNAVQGDTYDSKLLLFRRGIEVGQVFKLGTKYSAKLDAKFLDAEGNEKPCLMGCYGIGINRILASAIEISHDDKGPILPITIAPWEVIITPAGTGPEINETAEKIHAQLVEKGIEVLLDDRADIRAGVKFNDADLLGIPVRVTVGQKSLADGNVEIKLRSESESKKIALTRAANEVFATVNSLKAALNAQD